jgi:hypothetical protein
MEPYTTLSESDVAALYKPGEEVDARDQISELLRFVDDERSLLRKQKEAKEAAKKAEDTALLEQSKKEIKKTMELPGRVLTNEMGISDDGTV